MYVLFTDETNCQPSKQVKFFITGGLFFPAKVFSALDSGIKQIRCEHGYLPTDSFKFDTRARPPHVKHNHATEAKAQVVSLCSKLGCRFIAVVIHHSVLTKQKGGKFLWPFDALIAKFEYFLRGENEHGLCVVDNLPIDGGQWKYLSERFTKGLYLAPRKKYMPLSRIRLFAATCNNASHISSATDIVLGAFRYCVNDPKNADLAKEMLRNVAQMMHHEKIDGKRRVREMGLLLRPMKVDIPEYQQDYDLLLDNLSQLLKAWPKQAGT
jgi:hypothetical protein